MSGAVCRLCGNPETPEARLGWDEAGRLKHVLRSMPEGDCWAGEDGARDPRCTHQGTCEEYDEAYDAALIDADGKVREACPPLREGWARCDLCGAAAPMAQMLQAERRMELSADRGIKKSWVKPPSAGAQAFTIRFRAGDAMPDKTTDLPPGTRGVVIEGKKVCQDCASEWDESAPRRRFKQAEQAARDQDPADAVPADGAGLGIPDLMRLWGKGDRATRDLVRQLVADGRMREEERATGRGGKPAKAYWRVGG